MLVSHEPIEILTLPPFSDDRVEDVWKSGAKCGQRANQHVLALALLQRAHRQYNLPIGPTQTRTGGGIRPGGYEPRGVDAGVHHDNALACYVPFLQQNSF